MLVSQASHGRGLSRTRTNDTHHTTHHNEQNIFSATSGCRKFMALTAPFIQVLTLRLSLLPHALHRTRTVSPFDSGSYRVQTAKETSAFMFVYSVMDRSCFEFGMVPLLRVVVHRATTAHTALVLPQTVYRSHWALIKRIKNGQPFSAILVGKPNTHTSHTAPCVHFSRRT